MLTIERTGISTQIFSGINIKYPVTGGKRIGIFHNGRHDCFYQFPFRIPISF